MKRFILLLAFMMGTISLTAQTTPTAHCYAEGDDLWLDHYRADVEGKRPCVIFAFGGGFSHGTRKAKMYTPYFEMLLKQGFDVVAIDYRLGMAYTLEEGSDVGIVDGIVAMYRSVNYAAEDLLRATRFLLDNAEDWLCLPFEEAEGRYVRLTVTDTGASGIARIADVNINGMAS